MIPLAWLRLRLAVKRVMLAGIWLLDKMFDTLEYLNKVLGPLLIVATFGLTGLLTLGYYAFFLPYYFDSSSWKFYALAVLGLFILVNVVWCYWKSITIPPGAPPKFEDYEEAIQHDFEQRFFNSPEPSPLYCYKCKAPKPPRAHHCSTCNKCVLQMDHHCPWINGCVGFYNHHWFLRFLFWVAFSCTYVTAFALGPLICLARETSNSETSSDIETYEEYETAAPASSNCGNGTLLTAHPKVATLAGGLAACLSVCIIAFFGFHLYLAMSNMTTIEYIGEKERRKLYGNHYDLGWRQNGILLFGTRNWLLWMFPLPNRALGNGIDFPSKKKQGQAQWSSLLKSKAISIPV